MSSIPAPTDQEPAPHPLLGTTVRGTYRILRALDQGGMGMVFEAEHVRLRRRLAVKVLAQHLSKDAHALARFNREAEIISQLQHPHVVQVTDFDTTEAGEPYLVMELLSGESLATRLDRERCLPIVDAARIAHQASSGLAAAHAANIVHRDLKPANIFLTEVPSQGTVVKLLDFGISKRAGAAKGLTGEYDILGTPDYMAPEQALGKTAMVDHRGDQYALAVITFEMLAGQTPFAGTDVMDVLRQVISSEPPPIEQLAPHVPTAVGEVLRRALSKDPEQRFPSITDFSAALLRAAGTSLPPAVEGLALAMTVPASAPSSPVSASVPRASAYASPHAGSDRYDTGLRSRPPSDSAPSTSAPTLLNNFSPRDLTRALEQARQAHGMGDIELAVNNAETALIVADALNSAEARSRVESSLTLLNAIFEARLGSLSQRMVVLAPSSHKKLRVSPEQAFLLSRVDGGVTLDEAIDLSPLPRQKTLRLLVTMMRQGLIAAE